MTRVLLVEDDELVGAMVRLNLAAEGHEVAWARQGREGLEQATGEPFDLVVLDIALPGLDGMGLLARLRRAGIGTPVLMLTARSEVGTKVSALDLGADDYLSKPFDVAELLARARALIRRSQGDRQVPSERVVRIGPWAVDLETREAQTHAGPVRLSEREAALLDLLLRAGGRPLSRADILDEVWGMDAIPTERTVDNFLMRLRRLFEEDPRRPRHILTVRGVGYRLVP